MCPHIIPDLDPDRPVLERIRWKFFVRLRPEIRNELLRDALANEGFRDRIRDELARRALVNEREVQNAPPAPSAPPAPPAPPAPQPQEREE